MTKISCGAGIKCEEVTLWKPTHYYNTWRDISHALSSNNIEKKLGKV